MSRKTPAATVALPAASTVRGSTARDEAAAARAAPAAAKPSKNAAKQTPAHLRTTLAFSQKLLSVPGSDIDAFMSGAGAPSAAPEQAAEVVPTAPPSAQKKKRPTQQQPQPAAQPTALAPLVPAEPAKKKTLSDLSAASAADLLARLPELPAEHQHAPQRPLLPVAAGAWSADAWLADATDAAATGLSHAALMRRWARNSELASGAWADAVQWAAPQHHQQHQQLPALPAPSTGKHAAAAAATAGKKDGGASSFGAWPLVLDCRDPMLALALEGAGWVAGGADAQASSASAHSSVLAEVEAVATGGVKKAAAEKAAADKGGAGALQLASLSRDAHYASQRRAAAQRLRHSDPALQLAPQLYMPDTSLAAMAFWHRPRLPLAALSLPPFEATHAVNLAVEVSPKDIAAATAASLPGGRAASVPESARELYDAVLMQRHALATRRHGAAALITRAAHSLSAEVVDAMPPAQVTALAATPSAYLDWIRADAGGPTAGSGAGGVGLTAGGPAPGAMGPAAWGAPSASMMPRWSHSAAAADATTSSSSSSSSSSLSSSSSSAALAVDEDLFGQADDEAQRDKPFTFSHFTSQFAPSSYSVLGAGGAGGHSQHRRIKDITASTGAIVLLEHQDKQPLLMNNVGMAAEPVTYYRRHPPRAALLSLRKGAAAHLMGRGAEKRDEDIRAEAPPRCLGPVRVLRWDEPAPGALTHVPFGEYITLWESRLGVTALSVTPQPRVYRDYLLVRTAPAAEAAEPTVAEAQQRRYARSDDGGLEEAPDVYTDYGVVWGGIAGVASGPMEPRDDVEFTPATERAAQQQWVVRRLPRVYAAGQIQPSVTVPWPFSAEAYRIRRERVLAFIARWFRQKHARGLTDETVRYFFQSTPQDLTTQLELRNGVWEQRAAIQMAEEQIVALCSPEQACVWEALEMGYQRLCCMTMAPPAEDQGSFYVRLAAKFRILLDRLETRGTRAPHLVRGLHYLLRQLAAAPWALTQAARQSRNLLLTAWPQPVGAGASFGYVSDLVTVAKARAIVTGKGVVSAKSKRAIAVAAASSSTNVVGGIDGDANADAADGDGENDIAVSGTPAAAQHAARVEEEELAAIVAMSAEEQRGQLVAAGYAEGEVKGMLHDARMRALLEVSRLRRALGEDGGDSAALVASAPGASSSVGAGGKRIGARGNVLASVGAAQTHELIFMEQTRRLSSFTPPDPVKTQQREDDLDAPIAGVVAAAGDAAAPALGGEGGGAVRSVSAPWTHDTPQEPTVRVREYYGPRGEDTPYHRTKSGQMQLNARGVTTDTVVRRRVTRHRPDGTTEETVEYIIDPAAIAAFVRGSADFPIEDNALVRRSLHGQLISLSAGEGGSIGAAALAPVPIAKPRGGGRGRGRGRGGSVSSARASMSSSSVAVGGTSTAGFGAATDDVDGVMARVAQSATMARKRADQDPTQRLQRLLRAALDHCDAQAAGAVANTRLPKSDRSANNYYTIITDPVDVPSLKEDIRNGRFTSVSAFRARAGLIEANSLRFNGPASFFTLEAQTLLAKLDEFLAQQAAEVQSVDAALSAASLRLRLNKALERIVLALKARDAMKIFWEKPNAKLFPTYDQLVPRPMTLNMCQERCRDNTMCSAQQLLDLLAQLRANAIAFNGPSNPVVAAAEGLCAEARRLVDELPADLRAARLEEDPNFMASASGAAGGRGGKRQSTAGRVSAAKRAPTAAAIAALAGAGVTGGGPGPGVALAAPAIAPNAAAAAAAAAASAQGADAVPGRNAAAAAAAAALNRANMLSAADFE